MQEKKTQTPTQKLQMVRAETCEEDPSVNVLTRSGVATNEDKGKQPATDVWICKTLENKEGFNLQRAKETFFEAWREFTKGSTSTSGRSIKESGGDEEIKPFLQECIKLPCNKNTVENTQYLIDNCT